MARSQKKIISAISTIMDCMYDTLEEKKMTNYESFTLSVLLAKTAVVAIAKDVSILPSDALKATIAYLNECVESDVIDSLDTIVEAERIMNGYDKKD